MIKNPHILFTEIVDRIWKPENLEFNTEILNVFSKEYRKLDVDTLVRNKAFLVINNDFFLHMSDGEAFLKNYDLYIDNRCKFFERLVIPIYGMDNTVHGFCGYDNEDKTLTGKADIYVKYLYQSRIVFNKDREMFLRQDEYLKALKEGYICIVDGIFDKMILESAGIPAVSILGTSFTKYHQEYLRYIPNWIVIHDNDKAGVALYTRLKTLHQSVIRVTMTGSKDIDEFLRERSVEQLQVLFKDLKKEGFKINAHLNDYYPI